jgi:AbrB family looped-hinge helix DNA binding protein
MYDIIMNQTTKTEIVCFSVKGQVVIPRRLRKEFEIEEGTRACVLSTPQGILIKPLTATSIRRLRGILKRTPGGRSFAETWAEYKAGEKALEEGKYARTTGSR